MTIERATAKTIGALLATQARVATTYLTDRLTVRASRRRVRGKVIRDRRQPVDISLTIGRPNYTARAFIKRCQRAGEPFPIKKVQLVYAAS